MLRSRYVFVALFGLSCWYIFAYPLMRLGTWWGAPFDIGWSGGLAVWAVGFGGMWYSFRGPNTKIRYLVVNWMGGSFVFASVVLLSELPRLLFNYQDADAVPWIIGIGTLLVSGAVLASHHLDVKRVQISSPKLSQHRRVVQISDVHIGSRQGGFMARIVDRINRLEPDVVVITGDLIDSSSVGISALQPLADLKATTFFCTGNHERYSDLPKALAMLEQLGVKSLRQASQIEREIQFIGIDDADHRDQVARHLPALKIHPDHFSILLYHRPMGWEAAMEHGIDLMLSGHTHNGQIFPFNLVVRQQFERICGLYRQNEAHLYVSSGTGTWGPLMRLGSMNEISCFDLLPSKPAIKEPV